MLNVVLMLFNGMFHCCRFAWSPLTRIIITSIETTRLLSPPLDFLWAIPSVPDDRCYDARKVPSLPERTIMWRRRRTGSTRSTMKIDENNRELQQRKSSLGPFINVWSSELFRCVLDCFVPFESLRIEVINGEDRNDDNSPNWRLRLNRLNQWLARSTSSSLAVSESLGVIFVVMTVKKL